MEDEPQSGRPSTAQNADTVKRVREQVLRDRLQTIGEFAEVVIPTGCCPMARKVATMAALQEVIAYWTVFGADLGGAIVSVLGHCVCQHRFDTEQGWWFL